FSIRLRNTGTTISPNFNLAVYDKIDFKFFFRATGMDSQERFYIEYRANNAASWQIVATYQRVNDANGGALNKTGDFINNSFHCKTATLLKTNFVFPNSNTSQFRVRNGANNDADIIYIDLITITGTTYGSSTTGPGGITSNLDLWLKANKVNGTGIAANNSAVTRWTDTNRGN